MLEGCDCLSHTESRSQVQRWYKKHRACSLFRRDRSRADQQHSHAGNASGEASPGLRFAHIVEVDISP